MDHLPYKLASEFGRSSPQRWRCGLVFAFCLVALVGIVPVDAATPQNIEARFSLLEKHELKGSFDDTVRSVAELRSWIDPNNDALMKRLERLECWHQPKETAQQVKAALQYADSSFNKAQLDNDRVSMAEFLLCRGSMHDIAANFVVAQADYDAALNLAYLAEDSRLIANALSMRARIMSFRGELARALEDFQVAQTLYEKLGHVFDAAYNLSEIANTYRHMGDLERSLQLLTEVEQTFERLQNREQLLGARHLRAMVLDELGDHAGAIALHRERLAASREPESQIYELNALLAVAHSLLKAGKVENAQEELKLAENLVDKEYDPLSWSLWQMFKGHAELADGQYRSALAHMELAEPLLKAQKNHRYLAWMLNLKAQALGNLKLWENAYQTQLVYSETRELLAANLREQNTIRMRVEFDAARKEAENAALKAEAAIRRSKLKSLEERKYWQVTVTALSLLLLFIIVLLAVQQLRRSRLLHNLAMTDELTGMANRRSIHAFGTQAMELADQNETPISILIFDIDYFKRINDTWGHEVGDRVLQKIADVSQLGLRKGDQLGRIGGEEFLVVLPGADAEQAFEIADRMRNRIAEEDLREVADNLQVTVSVGLAQRSSVDTDLSSLTQRADHALYEAKACGRNRVAAAA